MPGTITIREYDLRKLRQILQKIPSQEAVTSAFEIDDENEIKDQIEKHPEDVEKGLTVIERECQTSEGPMDFLTKDRNGIHTVIEVKVEADDTAITQVMRYIRAYKSKKKLRKIRGIIVAERFKKRCVEHAKELTKMGFDLSLYQCRKTLSFLKLS
jgi:RecB family endonuclease NucS